MTQAQPVDLIPQEHVPFSHSEDARGAKEKHVRTVLRWELVDGSWEGDSPFEGSAFSVSAFSAKKSDWTASFWQRNRGHYLNWIVL